MSDRLERLRALAQEPLDLPPEGAALLDQERARARGALREAGTDIDEVVRVVVDVGLSTLAALSINEAFRARWLTAMCALLLSPEEGP